MGTVVVFTARPKIFIGQKRGRYVMNRVRTLKRAESQNESFEDMTERERYHNGQSGAQKTCGRTVCSAPKKSVMGNWQCRLQKALSAEWIESPFVGHEILVRFYRF